MRRLAILALASSLVLPFVAAPASAEETQVTGTIASSVSISTAPSASVSMTLGATGANTASGGTIGVTSNEPYQVTVAGDKAYMTRWDGTTYGTATLSNSMSVTAALSNGTDGGLGVGTIGVVSTTPSVIATSTGLTTDQYGLTLSQPTTIADSSGTYRIVLTYTASSTL